MTKILNQNATLNIPIRQEIFERADTLLANKLEKHSKVLAGRIDAHIKDGNIQTFNQRLAEIERRKGLDPSYLTVCEVGKSGNKHFHTIFFLDGNKTRSVWSLFEDANRVMNNMIGDKSKKKSGLIDFCNHDFGNGIMINRHLNDKDSIDELSRKISYLAKEKQKENVKGKTFFSSRVEK